ncbi:MAG: hypothetical protein QOI98_265 [Solirubrobacteraceae bacterium]|nr:hypothetical protein [Solirubrobacteraceae bacterium]
MSTPPREPTEEEIRAAYEAELKKVTIEDVLVQTAVSLVNLAGRRLGIAEGTQDERDLDQVRDAIDGVRGLLPVLERRGAAEVAPLRDALSRLQIAYAKEQSAAPGEAPPSDAPTSQAPPPGSEQGAPAPGEEAPGAGPAESSGRLWVPGR